MLTPLQISTQRFTPNGKGGYKSSEVDAFVQKVFKYYNKLYNDNIALNDKLESITPVIDEYNKNKAVIANVLISAQSVADTKLEAANAAVEKLLMEAENKAEAAYNEKVAEAERYYTERTKEADIKLSDLERSYNRLKADSDYFKNKYLAEIKGKVDEMIIAANEKAASIVSSAFEDAKTARVRADLIIDEANAELKKLYAEAAKVKSDLAAVIAIAEKVSENIADFTALEKVDSSAQNEAFAPITSEDLPEFDFAVADTQSNEKNTVDAADSYNEEKADIADFEEISSYSADSEFEDIQSYTSFEGFESFRHEAADDEEASAEIKDEPIMLVDDEPVDIFSRSNEENDENEPELPDVNSYLSKIFDSLSTEDDADNYGFDDLISESSDV